MVRSLTLGEVSREIHSIKNEISALKTQIAEIKKGRKVVEKEEEDIHPWDTTQYDRNTNPNLEIVEGKKDLVYGFKEMRLLTISYQEDHVKVNICIKGEMFELTSLLDSGVDVNILNKKIIPAKYWVSTRRNVVGLGNKTLNHEVPKASICFEHHCINLKFAIADIPVDCILGNIFLAAVEPHGSMRLKGNKDGYFISVLTSKGTTKRIELPYISNPRVSTMVKTIKNLDKLEAKLSDLKDLKSTLKVDE